MLSLTLTAFFAFRLLIRVCASTSAPVAFHKNNGMFTLGTEQEAHIII